MRCLLHFLDSCVSVADLLAHRMFKDETSGIGREQ